jgi:hypothetical protein
MYWRPHGSFDWLFGSSTDDYHVVAELDVAVQAAVDATSHQLTKAGFLVRDPVRDFEQGSCRSDAILGKAISHLSTFEVFAEIVGAAYAVIAPSAHCAPASFLYCQQEQTTFTRSRR